jgi:hypothetical protein
MKKKNFKMNNMMGIIIGIAAFIFVMVLYRKINQEMEIIVADNYFQVTGMYGGKFQYDDITLMELKDEIPKILSKTNGADWSSVKKGNYEVEGLGEGKLYIFTDVGPFLFIKTKDSFVILNYKDENKTKQLYEAISKHLNN